MLLNTALLLQSASSAAGAGARTLGEGSGPDLTSMAVMVAVFVLVIAAIAFGFRKLVSGSLRSRASKRDLRVVDVLPLGGKRQLAIVRCYDRTFALGLGEKSVDLVAELDTDALETDREANAAERSEVFEARLASAKARLLGVRDLIPSAGPKARQQGTSVPSPTGSQEFIA